MSFGSNGQRMVLSQEDRAPRGHVALLRGKTTISVHGCGASYCRNSSSTGITVTSMNFCDTSGVKQELIGRQMGDLLCLLRKLGFALVPVMTVCWSKRGQKNTCKDTVFRLINSGHTSGVHGKEFLITSWSTLLVIPKYSECKFVRQSCNSTYSIAIHEQHSGVFQQDNSHPHPAVETGKLEDRARAGRPCLKEARAPCIAVEMEAIASEAASGTNSAREAARRLGLPPSSVRNILRRILQLYPYKLQSCHELFPADTAQREAFAKWAYSKMEQDPTCVFIILWIDEAHFSLHGDVNNHNCPIWATSNPREYTQKPFHSSKVTA
ncbi:uncharacterized protein TNCV_2146561 [Trichonephila clavipes]|uniref:Transposase n=1 Tax=Trichonephila clavipes TaxID=2585209 RepID=A0A8X6SYI2_TRICX|nr:uncharacterized protein TNCV_2146561 [Trichonephila clavipes]